MKDWKNTVLSIIAIVLTVVLAGLVVISSIRENQKAQENERLATEARRLTMKKQEIGQDIYASLLSSIWKSFPGIVCWGDQEMVGSRYGNVAVKLGDAATHALLNGIETDLTNKAGLYNTHDLDIEAFNMGAAYEGFSEILVRAGARQMVLAEAYTIALPTDRFDMVVADANGNALRFAEQAYATFGETRIGEIDGMLYSGTKYDDGLHVHLAFGRNDYGETATYPAGTPVYTTGARLYRSCVPVLYFAESSQVGIVEFINGVSDILSLYGEGPYVLICTTAQDSFWDAALAATFGDRYIRNEKLASAMESDDYQRLGELTYQNLRDQGVFDGIIQAVETARTSLIERLAAE